MYRAIKTSRKRYYGIVIAKHQCRTLALLAQKGGAGKTTLALHLAVIAQSAGLRTLLVDCDPQRSAVGWWRAREGDTPQLVAAAPDRLRAIKEAAQGDGVDLIVVDTRPSVERDTAEVARAADFSLIPTRPSILDLRAIGATVDVLKALNRPAAIILNACPAGRGMGEASVTVEARKGLAVYGLPIAPQAVTVRAALAHALIDGRAVTEFEPDGKASGELRRVWKWTERILWPSAQA
jgi:chromosome partitioning protein